MRGDYSSAELGKLARKSHDRGQVLRLLALAAVLDGRSRLEASQVGLMDRQTLRDWVHRFNEEGPEGLINRRGGGGRSKLSAEQQRQLAGLVETGPGDLVPGLVRWRCVDLVAVIKERFGVDYHPSTVARILNELGYSPRQSLEDIILFL